MQLSMGKWKKHARYWISENPIRPGVWRCRDGGFFVRARVLNPKTGKQFEISKLLDYEDADEAREWLVEQMRVVRAGGPAAQRKKIRFSDFAVSLLERKINAGDIRSAKSRERWGYTLEKHLIPAFGDVYMDALTKADVLLWRDRMAWRIRKDEYSPRTANGWLAILKVIVDAAVDELELPRNPMAGVNPFDLREHATYTDESPNSLRPEDVPRFLEAVKRLHPRHYAFVALGFATGLRPSSLRPLRRAGAFPDVLWDQGLLLVRRSHTRKNEVMNATKTGVNQRLALPDGLMDVLRWHVETQLWTRHMRQSELLFPSTTGGFRSSSCLDKPFEELCKELELPYPVTPRGMRRTYQDLCRAAEIPDLVVRSVSGHATEEMQRHYSTVHESEQRQALAKVIQIAGIRR